MTISFRIFQCNLNCPQTCFISSSNHKAFIEFFSLFSINFLKTLAHLNHNAAFYIYEKRSITYYIVVVSVNSNWLLPLFLSSHQPIPFIFFKHSLRFRNDTIFLFTQKTISNEPSKLVFFLKTHRQLLRHEISWSSLSLLPKLASLKAEERLKQRKPTFLKQRQPQRQRWHGNAVCFVSNDWLLLR